MPDTDRPRNRRVTLEDVAARARVSRATASLVLRNEGSLSDQTRARVRRAMSDLGYVYHRGAASLRSQRSQSVGIIVPDIDIEFMAELTAAFQRTLSDHGVVTVIATSGEDADHQLVLVRSLVERQADGLVVIPAAGSSRTLGQQLAASEVPTVISTRPLGFGGLSFVGIDNLRSGRLVGEHLLQHGCRRVVYLGGPEQVGPRRDRLRGLVRALELSGTGAWVDVDIAGPAKGPWAHGATQRLLSEYPVPDAIVCHNDMVAFGACRALRELSVEVADRVCVVSHDDIAPASLWEPPLTTVAAHGAEVGIRCAETLLAHIADPDRRPTRTLIPPRLLVRESCGCRPSSEDTESRQTPTSGTVIERRRRC